MGKSMALNLCLTILLSLGAANAPAFAGKTIYVDDDATGLNDGSSWLNASKFLQDALMMAKEPDELRVAQGIYKPDDFALSDRPNLGRAETFQLKNGVAIRGGYASIGAPDPNARDIVKYETILSGDLDGNDAPNFAGYEENSYHVVTGSGTDANAILDGFTITGGNGNGPWWTDYVCGGGMFSISGNLTVTNCTFRNNSAENGGGMYNNYASPKLTNCTFIKNSASKSGAGISNWFDCNPTLTDCMFNGNSSLYYGGGMLNDIGSFARMRKCTFSKNSARYGGAIYSGEESGSILMNCTFAGNSAYQGGGMCNYFSTIILANCLLWGNAPQQIYEFGGDVLVTYSDVQGGWPGEGNIDVDPCFADATDGDYHLKSQAGRWDANEGRWAIDDVTSPCIDAGDPMSPIMHEPFPNGGIINMGAYGGTAEASKSYFGAAPCEIIVAGDVNGDCEVDFKDFTFIALHWLTANTQ